MIINSGGGRGVGLSGTDGPLIRARKMMMRDKDNPGELIDIGQVGEVESIDPEVIEVLTAQNFVPVIAPVGVGKDGESWKINADNGAALGAGKNGVNSCHIIDGRVEHALLLEILTNEGVGTLIKRR